MKKTKVFSLITTILLAILTLTACSNKKSTTTQSSTPSAKTILAKTQTTKFSSLHATWLQTDKNNQTLQKAEASYQKKPLIIYADFTTNSNHYKMWINSKHNYVQMQGTSSKRWFKTKLGKASSYAQLTDDLAQSTLMTFSSNSAKLFKVKKAANGYTLTYSGKNKTLWSEIIKNSMITSVIGIDTNKVKPGKVNVKIETDKNYSLTGLTIDAAYKENNSEKHLKMVIDKINQVSKMQIPSSVTKSAVDLGSLSN